MSEKYLAIAIDGPAAAGKTTTAKEVARRLNEFRPFTYIDTGALYRALGVGVISSGITQVNSPTFSSDVEAILPQKDVSFEINDRGEQRVLLNGEDVTDQLRTEQISSMASAVSAIPAARLRLNDLQREIASKTNVVMEGRDIGTVILPDADLKIFLVASDYARAERRYMDLCRKGVNTDLNTVLKDMTERDARDSGREVAPLKPAKDAIRLDNSSRTTEQTVQFIINAFFAKIEVYEGGRKEFRQTLNVPRDILAQIKKFLETKSEGEYQGEDGTISYTIEFPDGNQMDIKCCGSNDGPSWTEAVLFNSFGCEVVCSDVGETYEGEWKLEHNGIRYIAEVKVSEEN